MACMNRRPPGRSATWTCTPAGQHPRGVGPNGEVGDGQAALSAPWTWAASGSASADDNCAGAASTSTWPHAGGTARHALAQALSRGGGGGGGGAQPPAAAAAALPARGARPQPGELPDEVSADMCFLASFLESSLGDGDGLCDMSLSEPERCLEQELLAAVAGSAPQQQQPQQQQPQRQQQQQPWQQQQQQQPWQQQQQQQPWQQQQQQQEREPESCKLLLGGAASAAQTPGDLFEALGNYLRAELSSAQAAAAEPQGRCSGQAWAPEASPSERCQGGTSASEDSHSCSSSMHTRASGVWSITAARPQARMASAFANSLPTPPADKAAGGASRASDGETRLATLLQQRQQLPSLLLAQQHEQQHQQPLQLVDCTRAASAPLPADSEGSDMPPSGPCSPQELALAPFTATTTSRMGAPLQLRARAPQRLTFRAGPGLRRAPTDPASSISRPGRLSMRITKPARPSLQPPAKAQLAALQRQERQQLMLLQRLEQQRLEQQRLEQQQQLLLQRLEQQREDLHRAREHVQAVLLAEAGMASSPF